jgi:hypothetical protein
MCASSDDKFQPFTNGSSRSGDRPRTCKPRRQEATIRSHLITAVTLIAAVGTFNCATQTDKAPESVGSTKQAIQCMVVGEDGQPTPGTYCECNPNDANVCPQAGEPCSCTYECDLSCGEADGTTAPGGACVVDMHHINDVCGVNAIAAAASDSGGGEASGGGDEPGPITISCYTPRPPIPNPQPPVAPPPPQPPVEPDAGPFECTPLDRLEPLPPPCKQLDTKNTPDPNDDEWVDLDPPPAPGDENYEMCVTCYDSTKAAYDAFWAHQAAIADYYDCIACAAAAARVGAYHPGCSAEHQRAGCMGGVWACAEAEKTLCTGTKGTQGGDTCPNECGGGEGEGEGGEPEAP